MQPEVQLDLVIRLIELVALIGGGGILVFKLGRAVASFEEVGKQQAEDINELKLEVKGLARITTQMALQNQRLDNISTRIGLSEKAIDEIRHGEGFIFPIGTHIAKK